METILGNLSIIFLAIIEIYAVSIFVRIIVKKGKVLRFICLLPIVILMVVCISRIINAFFGYQGLFPLVGFRYIAARILSPIIIAYYIFIVAPTHQFGIYMFFVVLGVSLDILEVLYEHALNALVVADILQATAFIVCAIFMKGSLENTCVIKKE